MIYTYNQLSFKWAFLRRWCASIRHSNIKTKGLTNNNNTSAFNPLGVIGQKTALEIRQRVSMTKCLKYHSSPNRRRFMSASSRFCWLLYCQSVNSYWGKCWQRRENLNSKRWQIVICENILNWNNAWKSPHWNFSIRPILTGNQSNHMFLSTIQIHLQSRNYKAILIMLLILAIRSYSRKNL